MIDSNRGSKPIAWTIAGSDSGGGAGIQADLQSFGDFDVHGCSVLTASTAQNSQAVTGIQSLPPEHIQQQIQALKDDLPAAAIKIGMLDNVATVEVVATALADCDAYVVCDPVLQSSSGKPLLDASALAQFESQLLPHVDLLTPNMPEAECLIGQPIVSTDDMAWAAQCILDKGCRAVLITGGHGAALQDGAGNYCCGDYYSDGQQSFWLLAEKINTPHTHGSGCTLSSAITACIAKGFCVEDAMVLARAYVTQGIRQAASIGRGPGPVVHGGFPQQLSDFPIITKHLNGPMQQSYPSCDTKRLGLYPVVDSVEWLARLLPLGISAVQLRIKESNQADTEKQISEAVSLAKEYQTRLFINDYWQYAIKYGAYGVHLGQEDLDAADLKAIAEAGLRLGVSTHSWWEIARAHGIRPSYIAIGPIYETTTKVMRFSEQGTTQLTQWVELLRDEYPLVAIGGIDYERAKQVLRSGVGSIAMVSAITQAEDYACEVARLLSLIEGV